MLLHIRLIPTDDLLPTLPVSSSWGRLHLHQPPLTAATRVARRVDAFRVALELCPADGAGPDVLVGDGVGVFGGDGDVAVSEGVRDFLGP